MGAGCMSMMVMYPSTKAKEHMDSYSDGSPSGVHMYSWGQITLCIAAVLADRSLPDELVAPLRGLASSSPSVSSSVMAYAGWCAVLTRCLTLLWMFCSMSDSAKALKVVVPPGWADTKAICEEAAVELPPALVPGWADKAAAAGWADVISTEEAWSWSILEAMVARAVVRFPSICLSAIMAGLSSVLVSSLFELNSGGS